MNVVKFKLSPNKTFIEVELSRVDMIETLFLLDKNRRSKSEGFDLTSKIEGGVTSFSITLSDLNISKFSGVYVLDIYTENGEVIKEVLLETSFYEECILDRVLTLSICDDCLKKKDSSIINSFNLLQALKIANELEAYNEAFILANGLDKYCDAECRECGNY